MATNKDSLRQQVEDATFLAKQFGIVPRRASQLVARAGLDAERVRLQADRKLQAENAVEGVPTPREPATDQVADTDEQRLKPVLHKPNNRRGGG